MTKRGKREAERQREKEREKKSGRKREKVELCKYARVSMKEG
jgi:hypothetical protein